MIMFPFGSAAEVQRPVKRTDIRRPEDAPLVLDPGVREELALIGHSPASPRPLARRALLVLLVADGESVDEAVGQLQMSRATGERWIDQFQSGGIDAIMAYRGQRLRVLADPWEIVRATLEFGAEPGLASHIGVPAKAVTQAWEQYGLRPLGSGALRFATMPPLTAQITDLLGMHLLGPVRAVALRVAPGQAEIPGSAVADLAAALAVLESDQDDRDQDDRVGDDRDEIYARLHGFVIAVLASNPGARCRLVLQDDARLSDWAQDLRASGLPVRILRTAQGGRWQRLVRLWCAIVESMGASTVETGCADEVYRILHLLDERPDDPDLAFRWINGLSQTA
jgi:hypothetical protein